MPTSDASQISIIVEAIVEVRPTTVLDVGPGYGKYGMLIREYLGPILTRVDAAEPWPQGMMPALAAMYDTIIPEAFPGRFGSAGWNTYDLIVMVDVLEHYTEPDGHDALRAARELAPVVIVATPRRVQAQGRVNGNPWEEHKSQWSAQHLGFHGLAEVYPHPTQLIARLERIPR